MQLPAAKASGPRPKKCWLLTLHPPASACRMVTCVNPCQCLTLLSDPIKKSRKMQMPAAKASDPRPKKMLASNQEKCKCLRPKPAIQDPKKCWLLTLHPPASACRMVTCVNPCQCLTLLSDPLKKSRKMQMPAAKASDPRPKKCWLLTLHPPASACRMVTCVNPCQCLTLLSDPIKKSRKMPMPAAKASDPRPKKCWLLTLHPPVNACRMVTCVNPCQCLTLLSDPIKNQEKCSCPRPKPAVQDPKKCCLLPLHPPASACRMFTCVTPCQCLALLSDPIKKSRKMQLPAAKASGPRPKKCCLLTLHPPASACRMVTCVNPCQCLTLLSDPIKKIKKIAAARGQSQRSKTQKMLAPNASSPCQRVSNGYLCQPLPVPNVAF